MAFLYRFISVFLVVLLSIASVAFGSLKVDISISQELFAVGTPIDFSVVTDPNGEAIVSYEWEFSNGVKFVAVPSFTYKFDTEGSYDVKLTVKGVSGDQATVTRSFKVVQDVTPSADFYFREKEVLVDSEVTFLSQAKSTSSKIVSYDWLVDTKPMTSGSGKIFTTRFDKAGEYTVSHIVTDNFGIIGRVDQKIKVLEENIPPKLEVDFPDEAVVGQKVTIPVRMSDKDGKVVSSTWKIIGFPEVPFNSKNIEVVFPVERAYLVTVKATDDRGTTTTVNGIVKARNLSKPPKVTIDPDTKKIKAGKPFRLIGQISDNNTPFLEARWEFDDGTSEVTKMPEVKHIFNDPGNHKIKSTFVFDQNIEVSTETQIEVTDRNSVRVVPTQVLLNQRNYIEVVPSQAINLNFTAYTGGGVNSTFSTVTWSSSNSNATVSSSSTNGATVTGVSVGQSTITVTVDGVQSQPITINVVGFTGDAVITQRGRFVGNNLSQYCLYLNRLFSNGISYVFNESLTGVSSGFGNIDSNNYKGSCFSIDLPLAKNQIQVSAYRQSDHSDVINYTKSNIDYFYGRNGFLYVKGSTWLKFDYKDSRFVNWDNDFSITYWTLKSQTGAQMAPLIQRTLSLVPNGDNGALSLSGSASAAVYLNHPLSGDFINRWTHVGLTYSTSTRELKYYIDGESVGSVVAPSGNWGVSPVILIGTYSSEPTAIDELRFWGKTLSSTEMANELFSPVSESSSDLLAVFNFDAGFDGIQESANGSGWTCHLSDQASSNLPQSRNSPSTLFEGIFSASNANYLEAQVPFGQFGSNMVSLQSAASSFTSDKYIYLQASSCLTACAAEDYPVGLKTKRFSPYIYVSDISNITKPIALKIPIDVQSISPSDFSQLAVMQKDQLGQTMIIEPFEKNVFGGYLKAYISSGGEFWVGISHTYQLSIPTYTNSDLSIVGNSLGSRTFYTQIPDSQSSYTLTTSFWTGVTITGVNCLPSGVGSGSSFPLTISGLTNGLNYCEISYYVDMGIDSHGQEVLTLASDTIMIQKGNR